MTFALGLASVFMFNGSLQFSDEIPVNLPKVQSKSVLEVITKESWKGFQFVGQGCGGWDKYNSDIWVAGYRSNDWKAVSISGSSHENEKETRTEFNARINDAVEILEIDKNRAVIEIKGSERNLFNIIFFEDKKSLIIISASNLETAIEFEKWQKFQK
jgi:hypothetical protein